MASNDSNAEHRDRDKDAKKLNTTSSAENDIVALVLKDHDKVRDLYKKVQVLEDEEGERPYQTMCWEIALHAVAEELIVYPLQESMDEEGKKLAAESRKDHEKTKAALKGLEEMALIFDGTRMKVDNMMKDLLEHMEKEETEDLVKLKEGLTDEQRTTAGHDFLQVKSIIPDVASCYRAYTDEAVDRSEGNVHFKTPVALLTAPKRKIQLILGEHGPYESRSVNKAHHHSDHSKKSSSHSDGPDKNDEGNDHHDAESHYYLRHRDDKGHVIPDAPLGSDEDAVDAKESAEKKRHHDGEGQAADVSTDNEKGGKGHSTGDKKEKDDGKNGSHHKNGDADGTNLYGKRANDDAQEPVSPKKVAHRRKSLEQDLDSGDKTS